MEKIILKMQKEECRTGRAGYGQLIISSQFFLTFPLRCEVIMYIIHRKTTVKGSSFPLKCLVMVMNLDFSQQHELLFWNFLELVTV